MPNPVVCFEAKVPGGGDQCPFPRVGLGSCVVVTGTSLPNSQDRSQHAYILTILGTILGGPTRPFRRWA